MDKINEEKAQMKKSLFLLICLTLTASSCKKSHINEEKFIKAYERILVIRETTPDSAAAEQAISKSLASFGYDKKLFMNDMVLIRRDNERFVKIIDSLRNRVKSKEFLEGLQTQLKKDSVAKANKD